MATTDKARAQAEQKITQAEREQRPRRIERTYAQAVERQLDTERRLNQRNAGWLRRFQRMARP